MGIKRMYEFRADAMRIALTACVCLRNFGMPAKRK